MSARWNRLLFALFFLAASQPASAAFKDWTLVGPFAPGSIGYVSSLAVDPTSPSTLYMGTGTGILKSIDSGTTWESVNEGLSLNLQINALVIDPSHPSNIFVGTDTGGVFRSTNGGASWLPANNGLTQSKVQVIAAAGGPQPAIYAGTLGDIFKTTNDGETWTILSNGLSNKFITAIAIDSTNPLTVYVGTWDGELYKSNDAGETWIRVHQFGGFSNGVYALAVDPAEPRNVYAGTRSGISSGSQVYKSTDGGLTWTPHGGPSDVLAILVDPLTQSIVLAGSSLGLYQSPDGGSTWNKVNGPCAVLLPDPTRPSRIYAGASGVSFSEDGGSTWNVLTESLAPLSVERMLGLGRERTSIYASVFTGGVYVSRDGGASWTPANNGLPSLFVRLLAIDPASDSRVFANASSGGVAGLYETTDEGRNWTLILNEDVESLAIDPRTTSILYAGLAARGVRKSIDGGLHWNDSGLAGLEIHSVNVDPILPSNLYTATPQGVFRSSDSGSTWSAVNGGLPGVGVGKLVIDPEVPATLYALPDSSVASGAQGVFKTTDGGLSWKPVNSGLTNLMIDSITIDSGSPSTLYIGAHQSGVFRSLDGGNNWESIGLDGFLINDFFVSSGVGSTVFAAADGGTFKSTWAGRSLLRPLPRDVQFRKP